MDPKLHVVSQVVTTEEAFCTIGRMYANAECLQCVYQNDIYVQSIAIRVYFHHFPSLRAFVLLLYTFGYLSLRCMIPSLYKMMVLTRFD